MRTFAVDERVCEDGTDSVVRCAALPEHRLKRNPNVALFTRPCVSMHITATSADGENALGFSPQSAAAVRASLQSVRLKMVCGHRHLLIVISSESGGMAIQRDLMRRDLRRHGLAFLSTWPQIKALFADAVLQLSGACRRIQRAESVGGLQIGEGAGPEVSWELEEIEPEEEGLVIFDGGSYSRGPFQLGA